MKIFFSVGEPSGDLHGANLIRQLQQENPEIECVGYGGPKMEEAGCQLHADLTKLAVMWFLRVLLNIDKFWNLMKKAERYFEKERPDAVVLIDYPGFNWWIARKAKKYGIRVFYYTPPQIWAWGSWRVSKMRRFVDHVLCSLPFEQEWFSTRGCNATFVGHPYFDEVRSQTLDQKFLAEQKEKTGQLVAILPGSRTQEVTHNLKWFLKAARLIQKREPQTRFAIASFKQKQADLANEILQQEPENNSLNIEIHSGKTPELIRLAECCMSVSGSVSLELLYQTKPTVILYWITRSAYFVQSFFRKVKYITLVNLLNSKELFPKKFEPYDPNGPDADEALFPEYLTYEDKTEQLANHVIKWLNDTPHREQCIAKLSTMKKNIAHGGASANAAAIIVKETLEANERRKEKLDQRGSGRRLSIPSINHSPKISSTMVNKKRKAG